MDRSLIGSGLNGSALETEPAAMPARLRLLIDLTPGWGVGTRLFVDPAAAPRGESTLEKWKQPLSVSRCAGSSESWRSPSWWGFQASVRSARQRRPTGRSALRPASRHRRVRGPAVRFRARTTSVAIRATGRVNRCRETPAGREAARRSLPPRSRAPADLASNPSSRAALHRRSTTRRPLRRLRLRRVVGRHSPRARPRRAPPSRRPRRREKPVRHPRSLPRPPPGPAATTMVEVRRFRCWQPERRS